MSESLLDSRPKCECCLQCGCLCLNCCSDTVDGGKVCHAATTEDPCLPGMLHVFHASKPYANVCLVVTNHANGTWGKQSLNQNSYLQAHTTTAMSMTLPSVVLSTVTAGRLHTALCLNPVAGQPSCRCACSFAATMHFVWLLAISIDCQEKHSLQQTVPTNGFACQHVHQEHVARLICLHCTVDLL